MAEDLKFTVLHPAHAASPGARLVEFGGYEMPVQYADGIMAEHRWTRDNAGAFDVSHMGPCFLELSDKSGDADADHAAIAVIVEALVPGDIAGLKPGQIRYSVLLNNEGGMIDDLMIGEDDKVEFAILSVGGFLGLGARLVAVRFDSLETDDAGRIVLPGATREELGRLPEFKYR